MEFGNEMKLYKFVFSSTALAGNHYLQYNASQVAFFGLKTNLLAKVIEIKYYKI